MANPADENGCHDHKDCGGGGGGGGGGTTYSAALIDPDSGFGAFIVDFKSLATNKKQNALLPDPVAALTFSRPTNTGAADAWDAVFAACENFFGPQPIGVGPTSIVVSEFTVPAVADNWEISRSGGLGGVAVGMVNIEFDEYGVSTQVDGNVNPVHFLIHLFFFGNTGFDSPKDPWLPGDSNPDTVRYDIVEVKIMGGTVKGVPSQVGCVSGGSAPRTPLGLNMSTLEITTP